ncbi:CbrC family protein [Deinococcus radiomollis]|uniref:CbrC family protein n=1 Tax=Deinococcus radiomollis TaxID=468916 RepID=UPI003891E9B4
MTEPLPVFRYHPDAVNHGVVRQRAIICDVCGKARDWAYTGPFRSADRPEPLNIYPWCVADGSAAQKYDGTFQEADFEEFVTSASIQAVLKRTPGFPTMNPIFWPGHHGECCVFLGDFIPEEQPELLEQKSIREELGRIARELGLAEDDLRYSNNSLYTLLFQCSTCHSYQLSTDFS